MLIRFRPEQKLYHGTIDIYAQEIEKFGIDIIKRKKAGVDFGPGFYLTVGKKEQAVSWAKDRAMNPTYSPDACAKIGMTLNDFLSIKDKVTPTILVYKIKDTKAWLELRHKIFNVDDIDWKKFVWNGRKLTDPPEFDWVFGPVADGGIYGPSPAEVFSIEGFNQLSIHNTKTAGMLELLEVKSC